MKSITEAMNEFRVNEETSRQWFTVAKVKWPVQVSPDIEARGGLKGKGSTASVFMVDKDGKKVAKGFQGGVSKASVTKLIKKWSAQGFKPNADAENIKDSGILEALNEGSLLEYPDHAKDNKAFGKLYKEVEKAADIKARVIKDLLALQISVDNALKISKKLKEEDFPADSKSSGGKGSTEWSLDNLSKKIDDAEDKLNTGIA